METKSCKKCGTEKALNKFKMRRVVNGIAVENICMACQGKREYSALKLEMFRQFGRKCSCCGENHPYFLSLEHINGLEGKREATYQEYRRAKRDGWDKAKYECLCMNCNWAKGHFGQCPHRTGVTAEQVIESLEVAAKGIGYSHRNPNGHGRFKDGPDPRRVAQVIAELEEK